jgi:signal transduction histidine kinase/CheY-like chemotaxis protein
MSHLITTTAIRTEADIVAARQRAHRLAELLGFERQDQTRIATAVSEIARNAFNYAGAGTAEFVLAEEDGKQLLRVCILDRGKGIADLDAVLEGRYRSARGMGLGIVGARKLLDQFRIESDASGTRVELGHRLPRRAACISQTQLREIAAELAQDAGQNPFEVLRDQDRELLQSLADLRRRQSETEQLNREIEDTNRGVVALYAELDARAEQLRRASEIKTRFLSNMSHEFRTPLNSILALSRLLQDDPDGTLNTEQQRQVGYIRKSAHDLLELVNDLLDLAKVEAGKLDIKPGEFTISDLFSGLRGALRPLKSSTEVDLIFESAQDMPAMFTDEGKVAQVLRNFISNALKFTEKGEVRVSAHFDSHARQVLFLVSDTGVGIAPANQAFIFEEFSQVEGHLQKHGKGTGLGLPLAKQLAGLLGGDVWVESELGRGSRFFLRVPVSVASTPTRTQQGALVDTMRRRVLVIDDDETFRYVLRRIVSDQLGYEVFEANDGEHGLNRIRELHPDIVFLDLQMPRVDGFAVLQTLRGDSQTRELPVIVFTSMRLTDELAERLPEGTPIVSKDAVSRERVSELVEQVLH